MFSIEDLSKQLQSFNQQRDDAIKQVERLNGCMYILQEQIKQMQIKELEKAKDKEMELREMQAKKDIEQQEAQDAKDLKELDSIKPEKLEK